MEIKNILFTLFLITYCSLLMGQGVEIERRGADEFELSAATNRIIVENDDFTELMNIPPSSISVLYFKNSDPNKVKDFQWSKLVGVSTLTIDCKKCTSLPPEISELKNVKNVNLDLGLVSELPRELGQLEFVEELNIITKAQTLNFKGDLKDMLDLRSLKIIGYELKEISNNLFTAYNLKDLTVNATKLEKFPTQIFKKTLLRNATLNFYNLILLPDEISGMKKLSSLSLSFSGDKLPSDFNQLNNLVSLKLYVGDSIALPKNFGQLPKLGELKIEVAGKLDLSEDFGDLKKLRSIEIKAKQLQRIPKSCQNFNAKKLVLEVDALPIFDTLIPSIEKLVITNYYQWEVKDEWKKHSNANLDLSMFPALKELNITRQNLKGTQIQIPKDNQIEKISFFECQLEEFPKQMKSLQYCHTINMGKQPITTIPDFVFQLPALNRLSITKKYIEKSLLGKYQKNGKVKIVEAR